MTSLVQSPYTHKQIVAWLRGLLTIAWADGNFDPEEQQLISQLAEEGLASSQDGGLDSLEKISPEDLAINLGKEPETAENFLRTAVMVAVADGVYSHPEAELLKSFSQALDIEIAALKSLESTLYHPEAEDPATSGASASPLQKPADSEDSNTKVLQPVKDWLDGMKVNDPKVAKFICKMVPPQCPLERDINLFGRKIAHIPAMCKLNPLYEQLVGLRFR
ncbi:MAG: Mo-dependent nitrogenase C-terminal domain-containing protein, partial [Spirulinaceae cyanobacterium]